MPGAAKIINTTVKLRKAPVALNENDVFYGTMELTDVNDAQRPDHKLKGLTQ